MPKLFSYKKKQKNRYISRAALKHVCVKFQIKCEQ